MPIARTVTKTARVTARALKKPLRQIARRAESALAATEERVRSEEKPERRVAKSRASRKRVLRKGSDREIVKAFGKKTRAA